jgi:TPR repeat protein
VSDQQFNQDKAHCSMMSDMAPPDAGSIEIKRKVVFLECLRSKGYEPVLSSEGQATKPKPVLPTETRATGEPYADAVDAYVHNNYGTAIRLMKPLAEKGQAPAQFILAGAYLTIQNYTEAVKWYRRAADQGYGDAQDSLGKIYLAGLGVQQNYTQAYMWLTLAAANHELPTDEKTRNDAAHNRDQAAAKMTPEQIAEARRLIGAWKPKAER